MPLCFTMAIYPIVTCLLSTNNGFVVLPGVVHLCWCGCCRACASFTRPCPHSSLLLLQIIEGSSFPQGIAHCVHSSCALRCFDFRINHHISKGAVASPHAFVSSFYLQGDLVNLFLLICSRLSHCCRPPLVPATMPLPGVKNIISSAFYMVTSSLCLSHLEPGASAPYRPRNVCLDVCVCDMLADISSGYALCLLRTMLSVIS